MGYTMVTTVGGCEYRYTEWSDFNTPGFALKVRSVFTEQGGAAHHPAAGGGGIPR
jgi:hypothetical protein